MLQFIFGAAGSGKTEYCRRTAADLTWRGESAVFIVPEQYTFETECVLLSALGPKLAAGVQVLSFTRLSEWIAREQGGIAGGRISEPGRAAAMHIALKQVSPYLEYYNNAGKNAGFTDMMLRAMDELRIASVTPESLESAARKMDGNIQKKLIDLSLIRRAFDSVIARSGIDPCDDLDRLYDQLKNTSFFIGKTVLIDAFRSFTGQEIKIISRILPKCSDLRITLCADNSNLPDEYGLFTPVIKTFRTIKNIARQQGVPLKPHIFLEPGKRFMSPGLKRLERSFFRLDVLSPCEESSAGAVLFEARDRFDEASFCARECRRLIREEGYSYSDIAVIAPKGDLYADILPDAFAAQNLPIRIDRRFPIESSAQIQFVTSALDIICDGWQLDDIMRFMKTGLLSDVSNIDTAEIENYCFVWKIKGFAWREPFLLNPDGGGHKEFSDNQKEKLAVLNTTRNRVVNVLLNLHQKLRGTDGKGAAFALFELLSKSGVQDALERLYGSREDASDEQRQIWAVLIDLLDQIAEISGDITLNPKEFRQLFRSMITKADIGKIPSGMSEIAFGGAKRMRLSNPRVVFILGANEGEIPASSSGFGVFTNDERGKLSQFIPFMECGDDALLEEQLVAYSAVTSPSEKLYITYIVGQQEDPPTLPSEILRCLPHSPVLKTANISLIDQIEASAAGFDLACRNYAKNTPETAALLFAISETEPYKDLLSSACDTKSSNGKMIISKRYVNNLLGDMIHLSSSKLETFHRCRFKYFCRYMLGVLPKKTIDLDAMEYGVLTHYILENLMKKERTPDEFISLVFSDRLKDEISCLTRKYLNDFMGGNSGKNQRFTKLYNSTINNIMLLCVNLADELSVSKFVPVGFEVDINHTFTSKNGIDVMVTGKVDRLDMYHIRNKSYLRVLDYKTGTKSFSLSDILYGLNLQMLLYLSILCKDKGAVPAGVLYHPATVRRLSSSRFDSDESFDIQRRKAQKRSGILFDSSDSFFVLDAMENGLAGRFIPAKIKKQKKETDPLELDSSSMQYVLSPNDFSLISSYISHDLDVICNELHSGNISPSPIEVDNKADCEYCEYAQICRYDGGFSKHKRLSTSETINIISSEVK